MKVFFAVLAVVSSCVVAEELIPNDEQMEELRYKCSEQYQLSPEHKAKMRDAEFPSDEVVRNYVTCMIEGVAFHVVYYERMKRFNERVKEEANILAANCMELHFNYYERTEDVMHNFEDCVRYGAVSEEE